ncbi:hypothetical protein ACFL5P_03750 [candidate division KSB1 bacterium]
MKFVAFLIVLITISIFILAICLEKNRWSTLEGEIEINTPPEVSLNVYDNMIVILMSARIQAAIDSMKVYYNRDALEVSDLIKTLEEHIPVYEETAISAEMTFKTIYGSRNENSDTYREHKALVERTVAEADSVKQLYRQAKTEMLNVSGSFNYALQAIMDNEIKYLAQVSETGHFFYPKVPKGKFFAYVFKSITKDQDLTYLSVDEYYSILLTGEKIWKYSWFYPVEVTEPTYIKLDESKMTNIFK